MNHQNKNSKIKTINPRRTNTMAKHIRNMSQLQKVLQKNDKITKKREK